MNTTFCIVPLVLFMSTISDASEKYTFIGEVKDFNCPAHVVIEKGARVNPDFKISPDKAVALSGVRCPSKLVVLVYVDTENYYITHFGEPGTTYTRVVNGKTAEVSFIDSRGDSP